MGLPLRLASHVRACRDGDWVVFLDLKRDRYSALPFRPEDETTWRALGVEAGDDAATAHYSRSVMEVLERQGYLASADTRGATVLAPRAAPDWLALWFSLCWARRIVRQKRWDIAVASITAWKARVGEGIDDPAIVAKYEAARPWFPERRVCFFDSLSLVAFMLSRGVRADWVVGVYGRPFSAHCWIERDGLILNSPNDACDEHVEIMRV